MRCSCISNPSSYCRDAANLGCLTSELMAVLPETSTSVLSARTSAPCLLINPITKPCLLALMPHLGLGADLCDASGSGDDYWLGCRIIPC